MSSDPKPGASPIEERPDPKDLGEEIDNALSVVGGFLKGEITAGDVFDGVLRKFFPDKPKTEEKKDPPKPNLRAVEGGQR